MKRACCVVIGSALVAGGCAGPRPTTILTEPPGAAVYVDKASLGASPVDYAFDFKKKPNYVLSTRQTGYFDAERVISRNTPGVGDRVTVGLTADESWTATTTSEATNTWLRIEVDDRVDADGMWQRLVDSVTGRFVNIEQMDKASGYIRSAAMSRTFTHPMRGEFTVRTQFIGSIAQSDPLVYKLRIESVSVDKSGMTRPYDRVFKEDAVLVQELQSRLGIRVNQPSRSRSRQRKTPGGQGSGRGGGLRTNPAATPASTRA